MCGGAPSRPQTSRWHVSSMMNRDKCNNNNNNTSNSTNNKGNWNHLKAFPQISAQRRGKERNQGTTENSHIGHCTYTAGSKGKGKAVPLQAWNGPEGSRMLRFPDFMTTAQDGGKVVSLTYRSPLPTGNTTLREVLV